MQQLLGKLVTVDKMVAYLFATDVVEQKMEKSNWLREALNFSTIQKGAKLSFEENDFAASVLPMPLRLAQVSLKVRCTTGDANISTNISCHSPTPVDRF